MVTQECFLGVSLEEQGRSREPVRVLPYRCLSCPRYAERSHDVCGQGLRDAGEEICLVRDAEALTRGLMSWFDVDTHACFVLDANRKVKDANPAAAELIESGVFSLKSGALSVNSTEGDDGVDAALMSVAQNASARTRVIIRGHDHVWRSLELRRAWGDTPLVFLSVRAQARTDSMAMEPLAEAFHLTPAQARVMAGLAEGMVPKEVGRWMGVSTHTVRTHLRAIYGKLRVRGIAGALRLTAQLLD